MKEMIKQLINFATFNASLKTDTISLKFKNIHTNHELKFSSWKTDATRAKLIGDYWFNSVFKHFSFVFFSSLILTLIFTYQLQLIPVFIAGCISFPIVYLFSYKPLYSLIYLPALEIIKDENDQKYLADIKKCKQAQLPNFTLVLIYFVMECADQTTSLSCDDACALKLTKLFGVDSGSIKKCLELLLIKSKRKNLTERKKTELKNRFAEAYYFLEKTQLKQHLSKLKKFEMLFFNSPEV